MISCASKNDKTKIGDNSPTIAINDSIRDKLEVLNDFLDTKIKDRSKKIMIHSKKINTNMTLRILRLNDIYVLDSIDSKKNYEDKTFYKEAEWEIARKKYSKNSIAEIEDANDSGGECCWVAENFNYKNVIFEELRIGLPAFEKKYISSPNFNYFCFSEPIFYQNKEYLIFTVFDGIIFDGLSGNSKIIIYKKKNGKWIQTHIGIPNWIS